MIRYVAESTESGVELIAELSDRPGDHCHPLPYHNADQFEWGYEGAGPTNLALTILEDIMWRRFATDFMRDVVATKERKKVAVFTEEEIMAWFRKKLESISTE